MYPNNAAVRRHVTTLVYYVKRIAKSGADAVDVRAKSIARIDELKTQISDSLKKISETGAKMILNQNRILTLGYSTVIKNILLNAYRVKRKFTVYCTESRPLNEGVLMAEELAAAGIQSVLIPDNAVMSVMPEMNLVITGADRICEEVYIKCISTRSARMLWRWVLRCARCRSMCRLKPTKF
jgi:translation initiation factor 2B subunit (eIF-2B alpha/beta/delta family)